MAGISVKLVIMLVATALITITGNAAIHRKLIPYNPSCIKNCDNSCRSKPNPRDCYTNCIVNCYPPAVSNVISSHCKTNCENSTCSRFVSGIILIELLVLLVCFVKEYKIIFVSYSETLFRAG